MKDKIAHGLTRMKRIKNIATKNTKKRKEKVSFDTLRMVTNREFLPAELSQWLAQFLDHYGGFQPSVRSCIFGV